MDSPRLRLGCIAENWQRRALSGLLRRGIFDHLRRSESGRTQKANTSYTTTGWAGASTFSVQKRPLTGLGLDDGFEPRAAGLKSRPSLVQQIDSPNRYKSYAATQPEKPTLVATAARSEGSMTELRDEVAVGAHTV
jgi:hypothetical protein